MTESVTDIIVARSRSQERLNTMIAWSLGLHAAVIVGVLFAPPARDEAPATIMTISLSGSEGVRSEGLTQAGAQPVQEAAPPEPKPRVVTPPREKVEMTIPDPRARTRVRPRQQTAETPAPATPETAPSPTRVRGQGFGLSTSGGGGVGGVTLDISGDFCCQEYLNQMVLAIRARWSQRQGIVGTTGMKFTIMRDGTIRDIQVEKSSGFVVLDNESQHALAATARLAPLPGAYPNPTLTVHLQFDYSR